MAQLDEEGISAIQTLNDMGISEIRLRDTLLRSVNASDMFARAQNMASDAWEKNTALAEKSATRYATVESQMTNLKNKASLFAQTLGDDLQPIVSQLMSGASGYIERLMSLDEAQRQQLIKWAAIAAAIGPVLVAVSKFERGLGLMVTGFGKFATAVGAAGGGLGGFLTALSKSPTVWLAVAAAVVVGTVAIADYISGAKQAREALKGLEETAKSWKDTAAQTFYNASNNGLSFFGMSKDDFVNAKVNAHTWVQGVIAEWTDGQAETDEIVQSWTDSFKNLTGTTRTSLEALQQTAKESGHTTVSDQLTADIKTLNDMDREVEKLLKKRQRGNLTDTDKIRLQELIDTREAIEIKYHLSSTDTGGFDSVVTKVEAGVKKKSYSMSSTYIDGYGSVDYSALEGIDYTAPENPVVRLGDRVLYNYTEGDDVKELQQSLISLGFDCGSYGADGEYGDCTEMAVTSFQKAHGLSASGKYDAATHGALTAALAAQPGDAEAPKAKFVEIQMNRQCYIRTQPNTDGDKLGIAHSGDRLPYLGTTYDNGWFSVKYKDKPACVSGKYARLVE